jgi:hypothetical protein
MPTSPVFCCALYLAAGITLFIATQLRTEPLGPQRRPLERALARGEVGPGVPRLDPDDALANAAILKLQLNEVGTPGLDEDDCRSAARTFSILLDGRLSRVRFGARAVCQLRRLKQISVAQPGFGHRGLGEVAAFVLGRRMITQGADDVDVTRIVVPPFKFTGDTVTMPDTDLGPLLAGEKFIGTYHTHPEGDLEQGVLSMTDLRYMKYGYIDFHGQVGSLRRPTAELDWLFDIVEPRDGDWNVYSHDRERLSELYDECSSEATCPVDNLRITGSRYYLFTRFYDDRDGIL